MPRGVKKSTLDTLKQQGVKILASLQHEIDAKEKSLAGLKAEADRWRSALGASGRAGGGGVPAKKRRRAKGKRVDWNATFVDDVERELEVLQKNSNPFRWQWSKTFIFLPLITSLRCRCIDHEAIIRAFL